MVQFYFDTITSNFLIHINQSQFLQIFKKVFVFGSIILFSKFSIIIILLFLLLYNKVCKANCRSFLFNFKTTFFGFGPKITTTTFP